jgi:hypothetical protein
MNSTGKVVNYSDPAYMFHHPYNFIGSVILTLVVVSILALLTWYVQRRQEKEDDQ